VPRTSPLYQLTYTDYGSSKLREIAAKAAVTCISDSKIEYTIFYPNEPWEDSKSNIKTSKDGRLLEGQVITKRMLSDDGKLVITTQHRGEDDNRAADILLTYGLSRTRFYIRKDARFDDSKSYLLRNNYAFTGLFK